MSNYSEGKIYKLYVPGLDDMPYIGSTTHTLSVRLSQHKHSALSNSQTKSYSSQLFEEGNEVVIELLEDYSCDTKDELEARERYWIEQYPECLNKNIPGRNWAERWAKNRERNIELHKKWLADNKEHVAEYNASRKDINKAQEKIRFDAGYKDVRNAAKKVKVACPTCKKEMNKGSLWEHNKKVHP